MSEHYVYVVECADGSLYTGYTTDVDRRVAEHDAGEGAKYTRGRTPVRLVHVERFDSKSAAMRREYAVKQLPRREKERLADDLDPADEGSTGGRAADERTDGERSDGRGDELFDG